MEFTNAETNNCNRILHFHILPDISRSKDNQRATFCQSRQSLILARPSWELQKYIEIKRLTTCFYFT